MTGLQPAQPEFVDHPLVRSRAIEYRLYQARMANAATKGNTLVVLPTALGKTVVSALVASEILFSYRSGRVLVMAPTRPLVVQHRGSFLRLLKIGEDDVTILTGHTPPEAREIVWKGSARIVFATPEVVRNDIREGRYALGGFSLLVFDECHRAVKEYAYTDVASFYLEQAEKPLVLAMTASPGSKLERVQEVCRNLSIEQIFFRTEEDVDVKPYVQSIHMEWRRIDLPEQYGPLEKALRGMLMNRLQWLSGRGLLGKDLRFVGRRELIELGELLRYRLEESVEEERDRWMRAIVQQSMALTIFHMIELLLSQGPHTLSSFVAKMLEERGEKRSYGALLAEMDSIGILRRLEGLGQIPHPKALQVLSIVSDHMKENARSRILIFSQYRDTVNLLVDLLQGIEGVSVSRFVGQASAFSGKGMSQDEQTRIINEFREGDINVIVATSIAEEGLDIPEVDLVIFYEPIPSEIRYIQRRGRTGRRSPGRVIVLAANNTLDMAYLRSSMRRLENMRVMMTKLDRLLKAKPLRPRPPPDPLSPEEVLAIEGKARLPIPAGTNAPAVSAPSDVEGESTHAASKVLDRAYKALYMKLLGYGGEARTESLLSDLEIEGYANAVGEAAIAKLLKAGRVHMPEPGTVAVVKVSKGEEYEISVERLLQGEAVVLVDGKWHARLMAEDYQGPRSVLRKDASFRAVGQLYHLGGVLCLRIHQVTGVMG